MKGNEKEGEGRLGGVGRGDEEKDELLFAKNKWLIAHEDARIDGAFFGEK